MTTTELLEYAKAMREQHCAAQFGNEVAKMAMDVSSSIIRIIEHNGKMKAMLERCNGYVNAYSSTKETADYVLSVELAKLLEEVKG